MKYDMRTVVETFLWKQTSLHQDVITDWLWGRIDLEDVLSEEEYKEYLKLGGEDYEL